LVRVRRPQRRPRRRERLTPRAAERLPAPAARASPPRSEMDVRPDGGFRPIRPTALARGILRMDAVTTVPGAISPASALPSGGGPASPFLRFARHVRAGTRWTTEGKRGP